MVSILIELYPFKHQGLGQAQGKIINEYEVSW